MEHTKEPWHTDNNFRVRDMGHIAAVAQDGRAVALTGFANAGDEQESIANARRIIACVNACTGIPTELLEQEKYIGSAAFAAVCANVEQQRDELLKDAERYRYIRLHAGSAMDWDWPSLDSEHNGLHADELLDLCIDAAIAKVKP